MVKNLKFLIIMLIMLAPIFLTGCWDSKEINTLLIVTGVALDISDEPGKVDITLQIGKNQQPVSGGSSQSSSDGGNQTIVIKSTSGTIKNAIANINRDHSRVVLLHHNQVLLIGSELAKQGIAPYVDFFIREQQSRLEVPVAIVDGRADEILMAKVEPEGISGVFLEQLFESMSNVSLKARVRVLDLITRLIDGHCSAAIPILSLDDAVNDQQSKEIKVSGFGGFRKDKMVVEFSHDQFFSYIWTLGEVEMCNLDVSDQKGKVNLEISKLESKLSPKLLSDNSVALTIDVQAKMAISELQGFKDMEPKELIDYVIKISEKELKERMEETFALAQQNGTDIYKIGVMINQRNPKAWKKMKNDWDNIFSKIHLNINVKNLIQGTGHIVQSLEMEENMHEN